MGKHPTSKQSPAQTKQAQDRPTATVSNEQKGFWFRYPYEKDPVFIPHPSPEELTEKGKENFALSARFKKPNTESNTEKGFWYRQPFTRVPVFVPHPHPETLSHGDLAIYGKKHLESLERAKFVSPYPFTDQLAETETVKQRQRIPGAGFFYKPNHSSSFYFIPLPDKGEIPETHDEQRAYGAKWLSSPVGMLAAMTLIEEKDSDIIPTHIQCITHSIEHLLLTTLDNDDKKTFENVSNAVRYLTMLIDYYNHLLIDL